MGLGRIGPPFLHDARVYLSERTVATQPASTVTTHAEATNAPLVIQTVDDALLAAIELHDLPAPDDDKTAVLAGSGCPVPPTDAALGVTYGQQGAGVLCPAYSSDISASRRGEARASIERFHTLTRADQRAVVEFLEQL